MSFNGETVLITGATSGIGESLCFEYARRATAAAEQKSSQFPVIKLALVSRQIKELNRIKQQLLEQYPKVQVAVSFSF